ncbi:hypothetical protein QO003_003084 [Arthrobacter silviterrae]|nr:hypothetical protein [Arthrobacter silviterrae]MDQ0278781.1 hypothetical protein [Arthrobacter silviterrae]
MNTFKLSMVKDFFQMAQQLTADPAEHSRMEILQLAMEAEM